MKEDALVKKYLKLKTLAERIVSDAFYFIPRILLFLLLLPFIMITGYFLEKSEGEKK